MLPPPKRLIWDLIGLSMLSGLGIGLLTGIGLALYLQISNPSDPSELYPTPLWVQLIGSFSCGLLGGAVGLIASIPSGLIVGLLTRLFFYPMRNNNIYRALIGVIAGIFSFAMSNIFFSWSVSPNDWKAPLNILILIPTGVAIIASQFIASWYIRASIRDQ
jgi:hypothetical protein